MESFRRSSYEVETVMKSIIGGQTSSAGYKGVPPLLHLLTHSNQPEAGLIYAKGLLTSLAL